MSLNRNGFPSFVNRELPPAVPGDFASQNPRATVLAGPGSLKADSAFPVVIGNFAWGLDSAGVAYGSDAAGGVVGFVANELQTVITDFLGQQRMSVQAGFPVTLYSHGDFWAYSALPVTVGAAIYADRDTGAPTPQAAAFVGVGTIDNGAGAAGTVLTITAVTGGVLRIGDDLTGAGITADTTVTAQVSGTPGGVGVYTVDTSQDFNPGGAITTEAQNATTGFVAQTAAPANATATGCSIAAGTGILTLGTVTGGPVPIGANVSGTGVPAGLFVQSYVTGSGGTGSTVKLNYQGAAVTTFVGSFSVGRLFKISRQ